MRGIGAVSRVRATLEFIQEIKADRLPSRASIFQSLNILNILIIQPALTTLDFNDLIAADPKMIFEVSNRYATTSGIREQKCV